MASVSLTGNDVVMINNKILADLADQDAAVLTFANDIATLKTGKNGNAIYALNQSGQECEVKLRIIRGSSDDKFLNGLMTQQIANFSGTVLVLGEFIKKVGDGQGKVTSDTYILTGGVFTKLVEAKSNAEGDTEQSVSIYTLKFSRAPRALA